MARFRRSRRSSETVEEEEFVLMYKGNVLWVIESELAGRPASVGRLLLTLICAIKYRNVVEATVEELSRRSGLSEKTVAGGLGELEEIRVARRPMRGRVELNPYLAWMGGDRDREKEQRGWVEEVAWLDPAGRSRARPHEESGKVIELAVGGRG